MSTYEVVMKWCRSKDHWKTWDAVPELQGQWKITGEKGYEYQAILGVVTEANHWPYTDESAA